MEAAHSVIWQQTTLMRRMEIIADNVSNSSTPGFKAEMIGFATRYANTPYGVRLIQDVAQARDTREGAFSQTGNALDLAIKGDGYFMIQTPLGERFTRNGRFTLDAEGQLTTTQGYPVLGDDGKPIVFAPTETDIRIDADGTVSTESGPVATIGVVRFADEQALLRTTAGYFAGDATAEPAVDAQIMQGVIEGSNVQAVVEMTRMMQVLRDFQSAQKVVESEHSRSRRMIQVLTGSR